MEQNTQAFSGIRTPITPAKTPFSNPSTNTKTPFTTPTNPAGTNPVTTPVNYNQPPKPTSLSTPAAQAYVNTVLTPQQMAANRAQTIANSNGLLMEVNGKVVPVSQVPKASNVYSGTSTSGASVTQNGSSSGDTTSSSTNSDDPYLRYLTGLFDPSKIDPARQNYEDSLTKLSDIQSRNEKQALDARVNHETILDTPGGLKSGAEQAASVADRHASAESAYGAIEESAAARTAQVAQTVYQQYLDAGKSVYEATTAAKKAAQDQANKEKDQQIEQDKNRADEDLAQKKFNEDARQFGLTYAQNQQKIDKDNPAKNGTATQQKNDSLSSVNLINSLLSNPNVDAITGFVQGKLGLGNLDPRGDTQLAINQFNQIKGILSLENRSKLKGQGAVSDFEGKTLDRAASSLDRNLSNDAFRKQLLQVKGAISTSNGLPALVKVTDPSTGMSQTLQSDSAGISHAIEDGLLVEYTE